jgi:O-antigen ligase
MVSNKHLVITKWLLVLAAVLISTVHLKQFYYSYDSIKWLVFDVILSILVIVNWPKKHDFNISYLGLLFLALIAYMLFSLLYAPNIMMGIEFMMRFLLVFVLGHMLINRYSKRELLEWTLLAVVISALFFSVQFLLERHLFEFSYNVGSFSPFGFKNNAAQVFNIWVPCLVLFIFLNRHTYWKAALGSALLLFVVSILMEAGTRGAVLGLVLGELTVFSIMLFQNPKRAIYFLSVTVLLGSGMLLYKFSDDLQGGNLSGRIASMEQNIEASSGQRIQLFKNTWEMTLDNPMGVGINNFEYVHPKYGKPGTPQFSPYVNESQVLRTPHNIVLKLYSEIGVIGGTLFLIILGYLFLSAFYNAIKGTLIDKWLLVAVVATLFHSMVSAVFLTPASLLFSFLLFTLVQSRFLTVYKPKFKLQLHFYPMARWSVITIPLLSGCLITSAFFAYHGRLQFDDKLLVKALAFNPHNDRALYTLSHVYYRRHRDTQASLETIERFLSINPYHLAGLYIQCERQFQLHEIRRAKDGIDHLLDIYPNYSKAKRLQQTIDLKLK